MTSTAVIDLRTWRDLFDLAKRDADDRRGLARQLTAWGERFSARAAVFGASPFEACWIWD